MLDVVAGPGWKLWRQGAGGGVRMDVVGSWIRTEGMVKDAGNIGLGPPAAYPLHGRGCTVQQSVVIQVAAGTAGRVSSRGTA